MSRIHRSLPPAGTRIGIAFSGGLDTRTAVAWMSRQGMAGVRPVDRTPLGQADSCLLRW
jgi:argininosuccinate synthase